MMKHQYGWSYFCKMLLAYLLVGVVLLGLMIPLCGIMIKDQEEKQNLLYKDALQNMVNDLEESLLYMRDLLLSDGRNDYINRVSVIQGALNPSHVYAVKKAQEYIAALVASNTYVEEAVVCFSRNHVILTGKSIYYTPEEFGRFYSIKAAGEDVALGQFADFRTSGTVGYFMADSLVSYDQETQLAFCYGVPVNVMAPYGSICLLIRLDKLLSYIPEIFLSGSVLEMTSRQGQPVMRKELGSMPENARTMGFDCISSDGALRLHMEVDIAQLKGMLLPSRLLIVFYLAGLLVVSLVLAYVAARRQFKPVREICAQVEKEKMFAVNGFTMELLSRYINRLQSEHEDVIQKLSSYAAHLRSAQLGDLLRGILPAEKASMITLPDDYRVCYGVIRDNGQSTMENILAINYFDDSLESYPCVVLSETILSFILPAMDEGKIKQLAGILQEQTGCGIDLYFSDVQQHPRDVHAAFEQARLRSTGCVGVTAKLSMSMPLNLLKQLVDGNTNLACDQIRVLMTGVENDAHELSERYSICSFTLRMAAQQMEMEAAPFIPPYDIARTPNELVAQLSDIVIQMHERQAQVQAERQSQRQQRIVSYLEDKFSRYDLSLADIKEAFGISERTALAEITAQTGMGFSAYVQKLRLERASQLLMNSDRSIKDIYEACGYNTLSAFHKAFKKAYGITPGEYHKNTSANRKQ